MLKDKKEKVVDTIIGPDTVIEGKIKIPSSLRVDGKVYGEVYCNGDVYIGKNGYIEPIVKAKNIIIAGEARGDLFIAEKVHVQAKGKLIGNATSKGLIIDDGGIFSGESTIEDGESSNSEKQDKQHNKEDHKEKKKHK